MLTTTTLTLTVIVIMITVVVTMKGIVYALWWYLLITSSRNLWFATLLSVSNDDSIGLYKFHLVFVLDTSMALCKTVVTPLLTHWIYCSLALSYRYVHGVVVPTCTHNALSIFSNSSAMWSCPTVFNADINTENASSLVRKRNVQNRWAFSAGVDSFCIK